MPHAKTLANAIDTGERLTGVFSCVNKFRWIKADVTVSAVFSQILVKVGEQDPAPATQCLCKANHGIQLVEFYSFLFRVVRFFYQAAGQDNVAISKQQECFGSHAVTSGAPGLLVVTFYVLGNIIMDDKSDI